MQGRHSRYAEGVGQKDKGNKELGDWETREGREVANTKVNDRL